VLLSPLVLTAAASVDLNFGHDEPALRHPDPPLKRLPADDGAAREGHAQRFMVTICAALRLVHCCADSVTHCNYFPGKCELSGVAMLPTDCGGGMMILVGCAARTAWLLLALRGQIGDSTKARGMIGPADRQPARLLAILVRFASVAFLTASASRWCFRCRWA